MPETLTPREAFKFGFMLKCAEAGLDNDRIEHLVDGILKQGLLGGAANLVKSLMSLGGLGLAGGAGLGAVGGYLAAKGTEPSVDPDEFKQLELITALRQHAEHARRNAQRAVLRPRTTVPRRPQVRPGVL